MILYVLFLERKDMIPECLDAITESQHGDDTLAYMKEKKSQVRRVVDKEEVNILNWVPIEVDYSKLLKNFDTKPVFKGKIQLLEGEEHESIFGRLRQDGQKHSR